MGRLGLVSSFSRWGNGTHWCSYQDQTCFKLELQVNASLTLEQGSDRLQRGHKPKSSATQEARHESKSTQVQDKRQWSNPQPESWSRAKVGHHQSKQVNRELLSV